MSVADPKKATLQVTGFWHQPRLERARSFSRARSLALIRVVYLCIGSSLFLDQSSRNARETPNIHT